MRIFCFVTLLFLSVGLYAEPTQDENASRVSIEKKIDDKSSGKEANSDAKTSDEQVNNEIVAPLTKQTFLSTDNKVAPKPSVSTLSNWPVVLLMLLGIVCLILGLAWFVKRFGGFNMTGGRDMRVLSSVPLGARERVALIDVKGQQFLVGVTTQNINHLHTFDEPVVENGKSEISRSNSGKANGKGLLKSDFSEKLQHILKTAKPSSDDRV